MTAASASTRISATSTAATRNVVREPATPARGGAGAGTQANRHASSALIAALLGFFTVTLDAVVVNVTLPTIRDDLGGGVAGLQWVLDGYTLMFAALLLSAGSLSDRLGAKRAFGAGLGLFVLASLACGLAPTLVFLVVARFVQGSAAAAMMPASMALIRQAYPDAKARGRAVGIWAMGGAVASSSGPVLGGVLTIVDWRLIFVLNVPVGALALVLLARTRPSTPRPAPFDLAGQLTGVLGMSALTFAAIEAGSRGFTDPTVLTAFAVAVAALAGFVRAQHVVAHPMLPLPLFRSRTVVITVVSGFAFMVGYYGLPFVISLFLQQHRGLSALATGVVFLPMMLIGLVLTPFSARIGERVGRKTLIVAGLLLMTVGVAAVGLLPAGASLGLLAALMVLVGLGGPTVSPPATAVLLDAVSHDQAGVASGVFNTSRQIGGALAIAVFGGLLTHPATFVTGVHASLLIAAAVLAVTTVLALFLPTQTAPFAANAATCTKGAVMPTNPAENAGQLIDRFGGVEEIEISTYRADGTLRSFVPIWVVAVHGALYVRSYRGTGGAWHRHATTAGNQRTGRIRASGQQSDVTFTQVDPHDARLLDAIGKAYRAKYARYGDTYLQPMLAEQAVATTVRLDPSHHHH